MKVFISSVRDGLTEERDALRALLTVLEHYEPKSFEDFTAQPQPTRQACADGVNESDVFLLILGPRYGDTFSSSGLSATEEEFSVARQKGMPIIVLHQEKGDYEESQQEFAHRVEEYTSGRYRATFTNASDIQEKAVAALEVLRKRPTALTWTPLSHPVHAEEAIVLNTNDPRPAIALHVIPTGFERLTAMQFRDLTDRCAEEIRRSGLIAQNEGFSSAKVGDTLVAYRPDSSPSRLGDITSGGTEGSFGGIALNTSGQVSAWTFLRNDFIGSLINESKATEILIPLIRVIGRLVESTFSDVALSVELHKSEKVKEGDPNDVGRRNSGPVGWRQDVSLFTAGDDAIPVSAMNSASPEIARELTLRIFSKIRERH